MLLNELCCLSIARLSPTAALMPVTPFDSASLHKKSLQDLIYDFISSVCLPLLGNLLLIFASSPLYLFILSLSLSSEFMYFFNA